MNFILINFLFLVLGTSAFAVSEINVDFNNQSTNDYSRDEMRSDWDGANWDNGLSEGRAQVVSGADPWGGNALKVTYPANKYGPNDGGVQFEGRISPSDEMYAEYYVKFASDFDFVKGGKLPGLCGGTCSTGNENPTGTNGWSTRFMFREDGRLVLYAYHMNWTDYGEDFDLDRTGSKFYAQTNRWYKIKQYVKMNTPGSRNGIVTVWIDDVEVFHSVYFKFRSTTDLKINLFYFSTFFGGSSSSWSPSKDEHAYFDHFHVWSEPSPVPAAGMNFQQSPASKSIQITQTKLGVQISNIFNDSSPISFELIDLKGNKIQPLTKEDSKTLTLFLQNQKSGIYFLHIKSGHHNLSQKIFWTP